MNGMNGRLLNVGVHKLTKGRLDDVFFDLFFLFLPIFKYKLFYILYLNSFLIGLSFNYLSPSNIIFFIKT